jgi:hypothetical protein
MFLQDLVGLRENLREFGLNPRQWRLTTAAPLSGKQQVLRIELRGTEQNSYRLIGHAVGGVWLGLRIAGTVFGEE